ncbi:hypothetical protein DV735_g2569, partial [Chaetothyriales sp. CBS 134920]
MPVMKHSIKPAEESRHIDPVAVSNQTEGEHVQPDDGHEQGLKRSTDNMDGDGNQSATPTGVKKRVTFNLTAPPSPSEDTANLAVMRSTQAKQDNSIVNGVAAPTDEGRSPSPATAQLMAGQPVTVTLKMFPGLEFDSANLVKIPGVILRYIHECQEEACRQAQKTTSGTKKSRFLMKEKIFRHLASVSEQKICLLAVDADKNGVIGTEPKFTPESYLTEEEEEKKD